MLQPLQSYLCCESNTLVALDEQRSLSRTWLHNLELEGFKSYLQRTSVGPFAPFCCVIGPNGCGKSVVGDAIAFVLGDKGRHSAAKSLQTYIHDSLRIRNSSATAKPQHDAVASKHWIQRVVQPKQSSWSYQTADGAEHSNLTQRDVCQLLLGLSIDTEVIDRFIVTQNRQAVGVQDPLKLAHHLELLDGTSALVDIINNKQADISTCSQQCNDLSDKLDQLERHRHHLAPQVCKWKAYEAKATTFQTRKVHFLQQQADSLTQSVGQKETQVGNTHQKLATAEHKAANQHCRVQEATHEQDQAAHCHQAASKQTALLTEQVDSAHVQLAKAQVHHTAAVQQAKQQAQADKARQQRMKTLQKQQAKARDMSSSTTNTVKQLCAKRTSLQQQLRDAQQEESGDSVCDTMKQVKTLQAEKDHAIVNASAVEEDVSLHNARLAACQQELLQLQKEVTAVQKAADLEEQRQAEKTSLHEQLSALQSAVADKQIARQSLQTGHMHAQLGVQSVSEQLQAAANPDHLQHQAGSPKLDAAVSFLLKRSQAGQLQGSFLGRLHSLAVVPAAEHLTAVNSVLQELCNLANCLVVSDRQTAGQVVSHFREHQVGMANCKIIAELSKHDRMGAMLNAEDGVRPLTALVEVVVPQAECVLTSMLSTWYLVKDRHTAVRIIAQDRKRGGNGRFTVRNLVTKQGELFKGDGEVVGRGRAGQGHTKQAYALGQVVTTSGHRQQPIQVDHQHTQDLQQHLQQHQQHAASLSLQVDEVTASVGDLQQQCVDMEARLKQMTCVPHLKHRMAGRDQAKKQSQLAAKAQMLQDLEATRDELAGRKDEAEQRGLKLQEQHSALMTAAREQGPVGLLLDLQSQLAALQVQCSTAEEEQQKADKAEKAATRRLTLLAANSTLLASNHSPAEVARQEAKALEMQQHLTGLQAQLQESSGRQAAASASLDKCKHQLSQCNRACNVANEKCKELQAEVGEVQDSLQADRLKLGNIKEALAAMQCQLGQPSAATPYNDNHIAPTSAAGSKRQKRLPSSSSTTPRSRVILSDSDSDTDMAEGPSQQAAPGDGAAPGRPARGGPQQGGKADQNWESEAAELAEEEAYLEGLKAGIDVQALEQDVEAALRLQDLTHQLSHQEATLARLQQEKQELEDERLKKFCSAMKAVNGSLGSIYQKLTAGQGDAYLSFTEDALLLFAEGVHFHVRPDAHRSRPFRSLSGGQQALATLALSFALQAAFPSPFYFFDEIDSALDTSNASRVADYIASQKDAQYLVVSHKPQVYERASCLVGVYTQHGSSTAVTLHVPQSAECDDAHSD